MGGIIGHDGTQRRWAGSLDNGPMPRANQLLHPSRAPAVARPAATLLLLRDTPTGPEVLMTRRAATARFAPGAYVFPGGAIDGTDAQYHTLTQGRPTQTALQLTQAVAALRECFEEVGVLLARHPDGLWATQADVNALDRQGDFGAQVAQRGLSLAADALHLLAHWVTDRDLPQRFDVPFFAARMPEGQTPLADGVEQLDAQWVRPADALARHAAGDFCLIFPTRVTLQRVQPFDHVDAILNACAADEAPLWSSCPRTGWLAGQATRFMEHDLAFGELAMVCPDGQVAHTLDWQHHTPVRLLRNVQRLTAPNPGMMTGPGTNSYLVGDPSTGFIVIDPGPNDLPHLEALWRAAAGDIRLIICTHSHPDHAPGARPLQAMCPSHPPVLGLPSAPTAHAASAFAPDRSLLHHEQLTVAPAGLLGSGLEPERHTLQVIHTPGHAANHLCLVLLEDGLLFSGDHILNGSTPVVDPPDGNMTDYLNSLDVLHAACVKHAVHYILPAHGYVMGGPHGEASIAITRLRQHRLLREAKVQQAMQRRPEGAVDDWLKEVYADVPERLWPVARRSLLAHLERLQAIQPTSHAKSHDS